MHPSLFQPPAELLELLSLHASGALDGTQSARLAALLKASAENRQFYRRYLRADTVLREAPLHDLHLESPAPPTTAPSEPWYWKAAALLASLACLASLWIAYRASLPPILTPLQSVAILTHAVDVQWRHGSPPFQSGSPLPTGPLLFERGHIQLEFMNGAVVVAEGPAEIELLAPNRAFCKQGKLRASIPSQAHGFTVTVPGMNLVDLGTEFALAVGRDGTSQVHVLEGEVRMEPHAGSPSQLSAGKAIHWQTGKPPEPIPPNPALFTNRAELLALSTRSSRETLDRWQTESARVQSLPETVFHYTFEPKEPWSRTLPNLRPGSPPGLHGAVVGCQWAQGRWPGKHALEFKGPSDRVRVEIPGEYPSATLAAWVRIESWDRWLSSLLLTDGFRKGAIHWQLSDKGELILGLHHGRLENHFSPPVISPKDLGRWVFLVTTVDAASRSVRHYLDGHLVGTTPMVNPVPLTPGPAELGNWTTDQKTGTRARSFNGRIDEFTFYSRALDPEEVLQAFQKGLPSI